jgi:hypothetical protein
MISVKSLNLLIGFYQSCYRNFKIYYLDKVQTQWQSYFPRLVCYNRFVEWIPGTLVPLCAYLRSCFGTCTRISFMDATSYWTTELLAAHDSYRPCLTQ